MNTFLLAAANLAETDYTGFTFFIGTMAMMAATQQGMAGHAHGYPGQGAMGGAGV